LSRESNITIVISYSRDHFHYWAKQRRIIPYDRNGLWKEALGTDLYLPLFAGGDLFQREKIRGMRAKDVEDLIDEEWRLSVRDRETYKILRQAAKERIINP